MKKIMIIGCGGAGKSTLARKLHELLGLELIHLDKSYWNAGWIETDKETWKKKVEGFAELPEWIIDGNYGGTMDIRLKKADTIIFMDYPTLRVLLRVFKRTIRYWNQTRPDMPEECNERFDWIFFHYIVFYNKTRKPEILKKLNKLKQEKRVLILKNDRETDRFLSSLREESGRERL